MDFLNWYDWITPTNPKASLFVGFIFTILIALSVWLETKSVKTVGVVLATGISVTVVGVTVMNMIGYFGSA
jgi:hypothetical protein